MKSSRQHYEKYIIAGIIATIAAISMIMFPQLVLGSTQKGIALWANSVLPALLPFFICAEFMVLLGVPSIIGSYFEGIFRKLFRTPGSSAFVFIISVTSGYPMGARIIGQMRRRDEITDLEGIGMLSFCSTSGPLFMLGAVGVGMFNSPEAGILISLAHYISALLNGLIFSFIIGAKKNNIKSPEKSKPTHLINPENRSILELLTESILSSLKTLGIICCFIIIFTYATDLIETTGLLDYLYASHETGFFKGLIEMTVGLNEISQSAEVGLRLKCTVSAFLISFGGLSIMAQSMSVLSGLKINPLAYLGIKLSHGFIGATLAYTTAPYILNRAVQTVANIDVFQGKIQPGFLMQLLFSSKMIIIIMTIFFLTVILELLFSRKEASD